MAELLFDILALMLSVWTAAALGLTVFLAYVFVRDMVERRRK